MNYVLLLIGFVLLVKGADYMIDGAVELAAIFGISSLLIGLSVTAMGTSAPEAAVSIKAALSSYSSISFGNILGSNIANLGLVLGLGALIWTVRAGKSTVKLEAPFCCVVVVILVFMVRDDWYGRGEMYLSRFDGTILLVLFLFYIYYLYSMMKKDKMLSYLDSNPQKTERSKKEIYKSSVFLIAGMSGVVFGARVIVDNSIIIAKNLGVSELLISVTIIALGTSLPEMATSLAAMKKGKSDIAIGNVVGSNIFNILFVLGLSSVIRPMYFPLSVFKDLLFVLLVSGVFLLFIYTEKTVSKKEGGTLLLFYVFYIVFVFIRK